MQRESLEPLKELDEDMMILYMSFDGILDWLELASNRQLLFKYLTVCSIARSEVYLSESRRRLASAIDDREVRGVMTEIVTRCRTS